MAWINLNFGDNVKNLLDVFVKVSGVFKIQITKFSKFPNL